MTSVWILALALFAGAQSASATSRIVGGNATKVEDYPSIVQVEFQNIFSQIWSQSCAGSILTRRYILSAAQCFSGSNYIPDLRRIRAGSSIRNIGGVISYVQDAFNHESFGSLGSEGDLSVVRLATPLIYSPVVQQASIIRQDTVIPDNLPVTYAGWGFTSASGNASSVLLVTSVFTVNNTVCAERYASLPEEVPVTKNMICAGLLDIGGRDACFGDSGGPLYYNNVVIGVISSGIGCGNATYPAISMSVASYTDWILSIAV